MRRRLVVEHVGVGGEIVCGSVDAFIADRRSKLSKLSDELADAPFNVRLIERSRVSVVAYAPFAVETSVPQALEIVGSENGVKVIAEVVRHVCVGRLLNRHPYLVELPSVANLPKAVRP